MIGMLLGRGREQVLVGAKGCGTGNDLSAEREAHRRKVRTRPTRGNRVTLNSYPESDSGCWCLMFGTRCRTALTTLKEDETMSNSNSVQLKEKERDALETPTDL